MNRVFAWPVGTGTYSLPLKYSLLFAASATAGGAAMGSILAALTHVLKVIPASTRTTTAALLIFIAICLQLLGRMGFFPQRHAQVPQEWLERGPRWFSVTFGLMLGFGGLTWLYHAISYAVLAAVFVRGEPILALLVGLAFGAVRGLGPLANRVAFRTVESAAAFEGYLWGLRFRLQSRIVLSILGCALLVGTMSGSRLG